MQRYFNVKVYGIEIMWCTQRKNYIVIVIFKSLKITFREPLEKYESISLLQTLGISFVQNCSVDIIKTIKMNLLLATYFIKTKIFHCLNIKPRGARDRILWST